MSLRATSHVKVTLVAGIALTLLLTAVVLTRSPPLVLAEPEGSARSSLGVTQNELTICQGNETLPAGVTSIRISIVAFLGSNMQVAVYHRGRIIAAGARNPDWSGSTVTVPVKPLNHATSDVKVCVAFAPNSELLQIFGAPSSARNAARFFEGGQLTQRGQRGREGVLRGRLSLAYLGPGHESWWSRIGAVVTHMGFGHFIGGSSVAILAALSFFAMAILTVRLTWREQP